MLHAATPEEVFGTDPTVEAPATVSVRVAGRKEAKIIICDWTKPRLRNLLSYVRTGSADNREWCSCGGIEKRAVGRPRKDTLFLFRRRKIFELLRRSD